MTENSDSGFTEINQTGSADTSQHAKSKTASPEPEIVATIQHGESSSADQKESEVLDNNSEPPSNLGSGSNSSNSSSDDDDSDDDDYEGGKPNVLTWVSL